LVLSAPSSDSSASRKHCGQKQAADKQQWNKYMPETSCDHHTPAFVFSVQAGVQPQDNAPEAHISISAGISDQNNTHEKQSIRTVV